MNIFCFNDNVIYTEQHIFTFKALSCLDLTFAASKGVSCDPQPALFHYHCLLARTRLRCRALSRGGPSPGLCFNQMATAFVSTSAQKNKSEWSVLWKYLCVRRKVLNYDSGLLSLIRINIVWSEFGGTLRNIRYVSSKCALPYDIWNIFCHAST